MTAKSRPAIVLGRAQGGRPQAEALTSAHAQQSERPLAGALFVPIEQLVPDPDQPRKRFGQDALRELADSLRAYGVLQPLVVREAGALEDGRNRYRIIAGERRYHAAQLAGLTRLPVLVREGDGVKLRVLQLIENLQREQLPPVDEARAYRELMELERLSIREVAGLIKRSHGYVAERLDLVKSEEVASAVQAGRVTASAAAVVAREKDAGARRALLERVEREKLQRKDVERILHASRPPRPDQRTLREVAREMGASEEQVRAAAEARREEPGLTVAEAIMFAMQPATPLEVGTATTPNQQESGGAAASALPMNTVPAEDAPTIPIPDSAAADLVLRVLAWAREHGIESTDLLRQRILEHRDRLVRRQ